MLAVNGHWRMRAIEPKTGRVVYEAQGENLVTDAGLALVAALLSGDEAQGILVHALGTDGTTPQASDVALGAEQARLAMTIRSAAGNRAEFSVYYPSSVCAFYIREAGVFGGSAADPGVPGSGVLFSRYLVGYDNSAGQVDITFDYTIEIQRV